jgi:tight adherence protein B
MGMTWIEGTIMAAGAALLSAYLLATAFPRLRGRLENSAARHSGDLREEFLLLPPRTILAVQFAAGALIGVAVFTFTMDILWALVSGLLPVLLSGMAVKFFRKRRRKRVASQLPGFLDILAGQVKAGHSLQEALTETIPLLPRGIKEEVSWIFRLCRLGTPLSDAFLLWEERMACEEVALVVRPLRVALPAGGNLVDLLERTRDVLRARIRMGEKMRSMTAQARLQAAVLSLLPPAFMAVLSKVDPAFLPRCLGTAAGKTILLMSGILLCLGWLTIRRILAAKP